MLPAPSSSRCLAIEAEYTEEQAEEQAEEQEQEQWDTLNTLSTLPRQEQSSPP
jgi:hypothetical protein